MTPASVKKSLLQTPSRGDHRALFTRATVAACLFLTACVSSSSTSNPSEGPRAADGPGCVDPESGEVPAAGLSFLVRRAVIDASREGVVALRLENKGCDFDIEVLGECRFPASYTYVPKAREAHTIVANRNQTFEKFVLSGQTLDSVREKQGALRLDEHIVGTLSTPRGLSLRSDRLVGKNCGRATHVVRNVAIGGFALTSGSRSELETPSSHFYAPPAGEVKEIARAGDPPSCANAKRRKGREAACSEVVRLELFPLTAGVAEEGSVVIAEGSFQSGGAKDKKKLRTKTFAIDRTEVTAGAYAQCVGAKACTRPAKGRFCTGGVVGKEAHPINCVRHNQAAAYCKWKKQRLPTAEEWERAARGDKGQRFVWGTRFPPEQGTSNIADETAATVHPEWQHPRGYVDGFVATAPVASLSERSPHGLLDAAGNVAEWLQGGKRHHDVAGASFGHGRIEDFEVGRRRPYADGHQSAHIGFRCAGQPAKS